MKTCIKCKIEKELSEFSPTSQYKGKVQYRGECRKCNSENARLKRLDPEIRKKQAAAAREWKHKNPKNARAAKRKASYGITDEQYKNMLASQNGKCLICAFTFKDEGDRYTSPHVDHSHETGKIRGLLCQRCNIAIGFLNDNFSLALRAADYLRKNS